MKLLILIMRTIRVVLWIVSVSVLWLSPTGETPFVVGVLVCTVVFSVAVGLIRNVAFSMFVTRNHIKLPTNFTPPKFVGWSRQTRMHNPDLFDVLWYVLLADNYGIVEPFSQHTGEHSGRGANPHYGGDDVFDDDGRLVDAAIAVRDYDTSPNNDHETSSSSGSSSSGSSSSGSSYSGSSSSGSSYSGSSYSGSSSDYSSYD